MKLAGMPLVQQVPQRPAVWSQQAASSRPATRLVVHSQRGSTQQEQVVDVTPLPGAEAEPAAPAWSAAEYTGAPPRRFTVAPGQLNEIAKAAVPMLVRLGSGAFNSGYATNFGRDDGKYAVVKLAGRKVGETSRVRDMRRPAQPLQLYEFEGCPFCRKVREAVSILDLDVVYYPCPKGGPTWRSEVTQQGGKAQFPFLMDPNSGRELYESDAIIAYMFEQYGDGHVPLGLRMGWATTFSCGLALAPRGGRGSRYRAARKAEKPLVLWAYEASPFCKVVREVLCELELPHLQRTCARGSPKRQQLFELRGHFQVPYLEDPNTGKAMFESADIIKYLEETYALPA